MLLISALAGRVNYKTNKQPSNANHQWGRDVTLREPCGTRARGLRCMRLLDILLPVRSTLSCPAQRQIIQSFSQSRSVAQQA